MSDPLLAIRDLSVAYHTGRGPLKALRGVNLEVRKNSIVGIVGESGCGKSTLISAIMRLPAPNAAVTGGRIEFEGRDLLQLSPSQMRGLRGARLAVVFQDPMSALNPALSIGRQMTDIQYRDRRSARQKRRRAVDMLAAVGIADPASRLAQFPHEFSGGMLQRIAIAMALQSEPKLLIADEPTTALDATLEVQIIKLLAGLQANLGCSVLLISHHLGVIAELCDAVAVMYAGEVVERGRVADLFKNPLHPYTKKLLACDPAAIKQKSRALPTIPGELPDLAALPRGCVFKTRCERATDICGATAPAWREARPGHFVGCHLATS